MSNNEHKILFPFFQVKSAGKVIEHTNSQAAADAVHRDATKPAEIWEINSDGSAKLIRKNG